MSAVASLPCFTAAGEAAGEMAAPAAFAAAPHRVALHQAMVAQRANARAGTSSTLTKGEVRGGGKKPLKQKHTGRARQGSTRNPHWPGGGVAFGPKPRGYEQDLPDAVRRLAIRSAVADKVRAGLVRVLESLALEAPKTRHAAALLEKLGAGGGALVVLSAADAVARRAFRNLPRVRIDTAAAVSTYDVLAHRHLVVTRPALEALAARCAGTSASLRASAALSPEPVEGLRAAVVRDGEAPHGA